MRIKEVEELVGISRKNIRFYEAEGLLNPGRELENSYRDYTDEDVRRLRIIKLLRKLDMPISEIGSVLDGEIPLKDAVHLHALMLEEQKISLMNAQRMCRVISADGVSADEMDAVHYLAEMESMEQQGQALVDLDRHDTLKKHRESLIAAIILVALLSALAAFLLYTGRAGASPASLMVFFFVLVAIVAAGIALLLYSRVREMRDVSETKE